MPRPSDLRRTGPLELARPALRVFLTAGLEDATTYSALSDTDVDSDSLVRWACGHDPNRRSTDGAVLGDLAAIALCATSSEHRDLASAAYFRVQSWMRSPVIH